MAASLGITHALSCRRHCFNNIPAFKIGAFRTVLPQSRCGLCTPRRLTQKSKLEATVLTRSSETFENDEAVDIRTVTLKKRTAGVTNI